MNAATKIPIVMAAFGTTTEALKTYSIIDEKIRRYFPGHEILWSYSSRMVRDWIKKRRNIELKNPHQVLGELKDKGRQWAVVQSLHLICGHEFYRLVDEVEHVSIRTSIGLPLLSDYEDYEAVIKAMGSNSCDRENEALVFVGHGTDHPAWASYLTLHCMFCERRSQSIFVGVVEGNPSKEEITNTVLKKGLKKVHLIPFMLVAGAHFKEDLIGDDNSWKTALEKRHISVSYETKGIGHNNGIINIFRKHIQDALDIIPPTHVKKLSGMSSESRLEEDIEQDKGFKGVVSEVLPNAIFRTQLNNGQEILAHVSGRMRKHFIDILPGDRVAVEILSIDSNRGRIMNWALNNHVSIT